MTSRNWLWRRRKWIRLSRSIPDINFHGSLYFSLYFGMTVSTPCT